jgi:hypothetical protein
LSVQFGEENITSRFRAAQIERYDQLRLIAYNRGISSGIGDAVCALAARDDDDGVRSGFTDRKAKRAASTWCGLRSTWASAKAAVRLSIDAELERLVSSWAKCRAW